MPKTLIWCYKSCHSHVIYIKTSGPINKDLMCTWFNCTLWNQLLLIYSLGWHLIVTQIVPKYCFTPYILYKKVRSWNSYSHIVCFPFGMLTSICGLLFNIMNNYMCEVSIGKIKFSHKFFKGKWTSIHAFQMVKSCTP